MPIILNTVSSDWVCLNGAFLTRLINIRIVWAFQNDQLCCKCLWLTCFIRLSCDTTNLIYLLFLRIFLLGCLIFSDLNGFFDESRVCVDFRSSSDCHTSTFGLSVDFTSNYWLTLRLWLGRILFLRLSLLLLALFIFQERIVSFNVSYFNSECLL